MGTVVLAREPSLARLVALKFLRETCPTFLERFQSEARTMARLAHPSIVPVHELGCHAGRMYLAMDYLEGGNLARARLAPRALVETLLGVVDALAFTHQRGIVHRDVKPENILLDRRGRAYLADFGLALLPGEGPARARPIAGTPLAMSPEQARGEELDLRSDLFSFGATLYQRLTGRWPFRGRTLADVLCALLSDAPEPLRAVSPEVPRALEAIVLRCLEKDRERRFSSAEELGTALRRYLSGGGPLTCFLDVWERVSRRREPVSRRIHPSRGARSAP
jgi:serine/threonine protein kinase